jgi:ADP-ribose pyrophosphatase YjhB (NUDIX family)
MLEIPGGMVDAGESPEDGGIRELAEETGYGGGRLVPLGWVHPNPAIQGNKCWLYAMLDAVVVGETQLDAGEDIKVELVGISELPDLLDRGAISHALAIVGLQRVLARWPDVG